MPAAGPFHDLAAEKLDAAALNALQRQKLTALLQAVVPSNKFYQAKFKTLKGDVTQLALKDLPFTTKAELVKNHEKHPPFGSNLTFPLSDYRRIHQTSGSTGYPLRWLDTDENWQWMLRNWSAVYNAAKIKPKDRICFAFSFGPFLGFWTAFEAATRYGLLSFPAGGLSTSARLRFMLDNGITVVCCTPTYALRMAEVATEEKINIRLSPVRLLIVAGEPGGSVPQTRARIEDAWGAKCFDHYGLTEVGPTGFECEKNKGRIHVIESEYIAESVDPRSDKPVADGEVGELVLTNLGRTGSPLIRYRTGDLVKLLRPGPCSCGRSYVALEGGILGRADDMLVVRGVNIFPSALEECIRRFGNVAEYRVNVGTVRAMTDVKISIEFTGDETEPNAAAKRLAAELDRCLGVKIGVEAVPAGTLPRFEMKARRWVRVAD